MRFFLKTSFFFFLDLTSDHASTLAAIVSTITMIVGFATPSIVTLLMDVVEGVKSDDPTFHLHHRWTVIFYLVNFVD